MNQFEIKDMFAQFLINNVTVQGNNTVKITLKKLAEIAVTIFCETDQIFV